MSFKSRKLRSQTAKKERKWSSEKSPKPLKSQIQMTLVVVIWAVLVFTAKAT